MISGLLEKIGLKVNKYKTKSLFGGWLCFVVIFSFIAVIVLAITMSGNVEFVLGDEAIAVMFIISFIVATMLTLAVIVDNNDIFNWKNFAFYGMLLGVLTAGVVFELGLLFNIGTFVAIIVFAELLFLADKSKPGKKESHFWFTAERKALAFLISTGAIATVFGGYALAKRAWEWLGANFEAIVPWIVAALTIVAAIALFVLVCFAYIKVNSLKYAKVEEKKKKKRGK